MQFVLPFFVGAAATQKVAMNDLPWGRACVQPTLVGGGPVYGWFGRELDAASIGALINPTGTNQPDYDFATAINSNPPWFEYAGGLIILYADVNTRGFLTFNELPEARGMMDVSRPLVSDQGRIVRR